MSLTGKVALVTGGSRGIGAATAVLLAKQGADVAITYSASPAGAEKVASEIRALGRKAEVFQVDLAQRAQLTGLLAKVAAKMGRLDILVNNAGVFHMAAIGEETPEAYDHAFAVNVTAPQELMKQAADVLPDGGRIINVGSVLGSAVPMAQLSSYGATKFAIHGLTRGAARDLGAKGILVNAVQPGLINTDMNPESSPFAEVMIAPLIVKRYGRAEEVAAAIAFLAGPGATYITGTTLNVDGGMLA
jgi:3-oxoacyl-[acyl-carrier protein] reductase